MDAKAIDPLSSLEKDIVDHYFVARPTQAAALGLHEYDGILPDVSAESTHNWVTVGRGLLHRLSSISVSELPAARRLDRSLLELLLEGAIFDVEDSRDFDRNPMSYLMQPEITNYIARDYAPAADRVAAIVRVLNAVPPLLEVAKKRLERVLPRPFVILSIQMAQGLPPLFGEGETFARTESATLRSAVHDASDAAEAAVLSFANWLRDERLPSATDDFALGRERFQRLLWVREGLETPVDEVLSRGRADLKRNQDRLNEIARGEGISTDQLLAKLDDQHPTEAELIPLARKVTNEVREFVRTRNLVTIPEPEVCHVRETPAWARDLWTAAMNSPGPFEKPVDGIYWVTTADPTWTGAQKESWLRTFNFAMLKNTTIHEVWPGHYLQALHFRKTEQTLARKVWFSYSFCEGWAHYCEQAALEAGLDSRSAEAEATQLRDALIRDARLIASIEMHTRGMSVAQATHLFQTEAHIEELHAQREAIRGTYNPEYFCYTLGKLAILDVRSKYLSQRFHSSIKSFHDSLLAYGNPPIGFLDSLLSSS